VSTASANHCQRVPVPAGHETQDCNNGVAPGVQFDFSAPGRPWYRETLLSSQITKGAVISPESVAGATERIEGDGVTVLVDRPLVWIATFHVSRAVARVGLTLDHGRHDSAAPAAGWVAFAASQDGPGPPFPMLQTGAKAYDARGHLIGESFPLRCC